MKIRNPKSEIRKIIFITLSNIGDVILTLPVLSGLRYGFPSAAIDVVVGPRPSGIFKKDPRVRAVYVYDKQASLKEKICFLKKLRSEKYDLALDMKTSLVPFLIGAKKRSSLAVRRSNRDRHKSAVHMDKLKELGLTHTPQPSIYIDDSDRKRTEELLKQHGINKSHLIIGISPSTRGKLKEWYIDGFIEVIRGLLRDERIRIILIGDASQTGISGKIVHTVKSKAVVDLTGKLDLNGLSSLIERIGVMLTGDSAALHIASDLRIKTVALFGPTSPGEYGPRGRDDIVIRKKLKCSPCKKATCSFDHECMKGIKPAEVLEALDRLLNGY